jgi:hypothetical protein
MCKACQRHTPAQLADEPNRNSSVLVQKLIVFSEKESSVIGLKIQI